MFCMLLGTLQVLCFVYVDKSYILIYFKSLFGPYLYSFCIFSGIGHARNWASKHFSSFSYPRSSGMYAAQKAKGYCCSVETGGAGKKAHATLTKLPKEYHKEKQQKFDKLVAELQQLSVSLKRPLPDAGVVPAKKPLQENSMNVILIEE